jgi:hypothetical protein
LITKILAISKKKIIQFRKSEIFYDFLIFYLKLKNNFLLISLIFLPSKKKNFCRKFLAKKFLPFRPIFLSQKFGLQKIKKIRKIFVVKIKPKILA